eukprot:scaffold168431_cov30-Tisochrysis_lutea.AAC.6
MCRHPTALPELHEAEPTHFKRARTGTRNKIDAREACPDPTLRTKPLVVYLVVFSVQCTRVEGWTPETNRKGMKGTEEEEEVQGGKI